MGRIPTLLGFLLLAALVFPVSAPCGVIHEGLERHLQTLNDDDYVSVIALMDYQADIASLNQTLKDERASLADRHEQVVRALQAATVMQDDVLTLLAQRQVSGEVAGFSSHWIANLVVLKATKSFIYELAARRDIGQIEINFRTELIEPRAAVLEGEPGRGIGVTPGLRAINAPRVWYELGITGAGTIVANCDTGVDGTHPALASRWRGANGYPASECWLNLIGGHPSFPYDGYGHGTHVMGTLTGLGAATQDTIGVAWGALWIATDPINQGVGSEFDNDIIAAYEWLADPDDNPETNDEVPDVVQNSWRINEGFGYPDCDSRWWVVIDGCEAAGCVTTWSAGNEGPGSTTIGSPADRATTLTNCFAVGAIDATNHSYPYPIADFSSRGPTGCNVPTPNKKKPEVAAPGVEVYSSVPGGGYQQSGWDGTSMAGPHAAGIVGLMREANPDIDVDSIKEIIMATAVDHGTGGEDNDYGWGVVDAYAAVLQVMVGYGTLTGTVRNASNGGTPVAGATVEVLELDRDVLTNGSGQYTMSIPAGTYTVRASHPSFTTVTYNNVVVNDGGTTVRDFSLTDVGAPAITNTTQYNSTEDETGPYTIQTTVTDYSQLSYVRLYYRLNGGSFQMLAMSAMGGGLYSAGIPGQQHTTHVEYYIQAADIASNSGVDPLGAPANTYDFYVAPIVDLFADTMESGAPGWTHAVVLPGFSDQWHLSTQRNHTAGGASSWKCGDTGSGNYANLLDAGLVTPSIELGLDSYLHYWQWVAAESSAAHAGYAYDGGIVEISVEGGAWQQIQPDGGYPFLARAGSTPGPFPAGTPMFSGRRNWQEVNFNLSAFEGDAQIRFRFGSDGATALEGWYVDDVVVDGFQLDASDLQDAQITSIFRLLPADPNPFGGGTRLRYHLNSSADVLLQIFDPAGRLVRTLVSNPQTAGQYEIGWDGRDANARPVSSGLYLMRLKAGEESATHKLVVTR